MTEFADRLRERIVNLGLTHAEVARRLGWGERRFGQYLTPRRATGKISQPDLQALISICDVLDTHPNYLLGVTDNPERSDESADSMRITRLERELDQLRSKLNKIQSNM